MIGQPQKTSFIAPILSYYNRLQREKYFSVYVLVLLILFLSHFIFSYDEEKVVALCLLTFGVLSYINFSSLIFDALNQKSQSLELEFKNLFTEKIAAMRKLRIYWRLFMDLHDFLIEFYYWFKQRFVAILKKRVENRQTLVSHIIKAKYRELLASSFNNKRKLSLLTLMLTKNNAFFFNPILFKNYLITVQEANESNSFSLSSLTCNKLNLRVNSTKEISRLFSFSFVL